MIAVLDYDAGNLTSVARALSHLGHDACVTSDPEAVRAAARVVFPGVGAAGASMESLRRRGLDAAIREVYTAGRPLLGICIGCQVVFAASEEDGGTECLGLLPGDVVRFRFPPGTRRKVPHMGWNEVRIQSEHPVTAGIPPESQFYFVHSFYPRPAAPEVVLGTARYGDVEFAAVVARQNLVAVQFHAEKSGPPGLRLLDNFCRWRP
jgi:glutamine amidotransferase